MKVRAVAAAGPRLLTVCVYVIFEPAGTDAADAVFAIARSAWVAVATVVVVLTVLFAVFVSVEELTVTVSVIVVPEAVPAFTCTIASPG